MQFVTNTTRLGDLNNRGSYASGSVAVIRSTSAGSLVSSDACGLLPLCVSAWVFFSVIVCVAVASSVKILGPP